MLKNQLGLSVSFALMLTLFATSSVSQQAPPAVQAGIQCGGQYECVEDRPMTPTEAQASRSHPHNAEPQDSKQIATAQPTVARPTADESREGTSAP